jgi:hypothetical protein
MQPTDERVKLALDLLGEAECWRQSYDRAQIYNTEDEIFKHDSTMTDYGDDAFEILIAYTDQVSTQEHDDAF